VPHRIDIYNSQGKLSFSDAWAKKAEDKFRGAKAYYIAKGDLINLKEFYNRDIDKKDVKRLKKSQI